MKIREEKIGVVSRPNTGSNIKVAMPQTFNGSSERVIGFVTVYKLYLRTKMRNVIVKKQI